MIKIYLGMITICGALVCMSADATPPPMVEKHVFTPGAESEKEAQPEAAKAVSAKELQKQVVFSGVIVSPKGKKALVREVGGKSEPGKNEHGKTESQKGKMYAVGEQVKGMTIKEIGSNFIVLAGQEGETKLNLYRGEKSRPAAPVIAQETQAQQPPGAAHPNPSTDPSQPGQPPEPAGPGATGPGATGPDKNAPSAAPDMNAPPASPGGENAPPNPFAEVLKKAAERRANRPDQPSGGPANPFMNLQQ